LVLQHHIDEEAGVVDKDYRGNIGVVFFSHSHKPFNVYCGDRIAQLICEQIYYPELEEVKEPDNTERGKDGFGLSGCVYA
jgi:dUTPase